MFAISLEQSETDFSEPKPDLIKRVLGRNFQDVVSSKAKKSSNRGVSLLRTKVRLGHVRIRRTVFKIFQPPNSHSSTCKRLIVEQTTVGF